MHDSAFRFAKNALGDRTYKGVVEFGSRNVNGAIRPHVKHSFSYTGVDLKAGQDVDVVQDAAEYQGDPVELVICMETLEHAPNWADVVKSAGQNCAEGGFFLMTCAAPHRQPHSAVDGGQLRDGEHYENIDPWKFEETAGAAGFKTLALEHRPKLGDLYYLGQKS